ncbi:hypothetical protein M970_060080 [Encephalitozoon cuniculi EcunIII-L]|uniref:Uncharacterized protein n=1 Tax=Encephalitozoon cuniculi TaxID=6035 RepID=M1KB29_ENCCN|nr:hypothetical protein ECU06_0140 [Encephalitozoon cuniculi]KMV65910.1 hypothetical protein M970_060080 [Encephalitozoon cuniculi EcunIII-L]UYI27596.1 WD40 domain-containing protein [Encephalitozoon cuniculi]
MKLNLFKNIKKKPSSIVTMSSNGSTIVLFRKDGFLELVDSYTLTPYFAMEFEYKAVSSSFVDPHVVACGTECEKLVFINTRTFNVSHVDADGVPSNIAARAYGLDYGRNPFYYSTGCNVYERKELGTDLVYRGSSTITSLLLSPDQSLVIGDSNGRIKVLQSEKMVSELQLPNGKINMICHVTGNTYVSVCDDGSFSYFDINVGLVLQTTKVRDSPLNVCAYVDDRLHLSGADSRIVAFSRNGGKFIRSYQIDTHYAEVRNIEVDNGRILTSGEDTILSVVWGGSNRYFENKIFHRSVELGVSRVSRMFYVNNRSSIDFYLLDSDGRDLERNSNERSPETPESSAENDGEITFKLSKSSAGHMGYRKRGYEYKVKICTEGNAFCSSAPSDFSYVVYSNSRETRVINLKQDENIGLRIRLEGANRLIAKEDLIVLQSYRYEILLIDVHSGKELRKIPFDDYREAIYLIDDLLILSYSKSIYSIRNEDILSKMEIDGEIVGACEYDENHFIVLAMARSMEVKKKYSVYKVSLANHTAERVKFFESYNLITSISLFKDRIIFTNFNSIQMLSAEMKEEKYPLGAVIYGCKGVEDEIIIIQDSWSNVRLGLPPSVFKEKFSNK